jgi:hypothetical protein
MTLAAGEMQMVAAAEVAPPCVINSLRVKGCLKPALAALAFLPHCQSLSYAASLTCCGRGGAGLS